VNRLTVNFNQDVFFACFDTVGWVTGRHLACKVCFTDSSS